MANNVTRVAIVTGGSRGIGAAIASRLGRDGMIINIIYRDADDAAKRVAENINASGGRAIIHRVDVSDEAQTNDLHLVQLCTYTRSWSGCLLGFQRRS